MKTKLVRISQKKVETYIKKNPNSVTSKVYIGFIQYARPLFYLNEFLLLKGLRSKPKSLRQSILFFTVHKSASTFIKNTVIQLLNDRDIACIDFSGYLSKAKQEKYYNSNALMKKALITKGYFYGAFRSYYNFPEMGKYKILLLLRDPRDVLTSYYFSTLYNHPLGRKEVFEEREKNADVSIDDFVIEKAGEFKKKYSDYCRYLLGRDNVILLKYEQMITDFKGFLIKLSEFLDLSGIEDRLNAIVSKTSFKVKKEDPHSFIRSIKAQDYKDKLAPATIEKLTNIFKDELIQLGYSLD